MSVSEPSVADLKTQIAELTVQRVSIDRQIDAVRQQWRAVCQHQWQWHQVAGEGRYCVLCGQHDWADD